MTQESLLNHLKQNPFVLAPMAGITDHAYRSFMKSFGAGIVVTELISATGIEYKSERTIKLMSYDESQRPVGIQLFGDDPEILGKAAHFAEQQGADFIDLNFGCPVPKVVKKGAGSAMLKDLPMMEKVLGTVVKAVKIPVTIKIRTGWDSQSRNAEDVVKLAHDQGITWVAIHGRTRAQGYSGLSDWDYISQVKSKAKLPIIGNGDILFATQAVDQLLKSGCDGIMIGRGALKSPFIFSDSLAILSNKHVDLRANRDYVSLFLKLREYILAHCDDHISQIQLKKFAAWFATGYPGAAQFRKNIFQVKSVEEITLAAVNFFETLNNIQQEDTSKEAFLMGGHG